MTTPAQAADRLCEAIDRAGSPACVGIDPVLERLPGELRAARVPPASAIKAFSLSVLDAVAGAVGVVKPQSACFERYGSEGVAALEAVVEHARSLGLFVILDAKRGDIGSSAAHYGAGAAAMGADAITVNPYMGRSAVRPFLDEGLMVFALARTSNPDSDELQAAALEEGGIVAERVARMIADMGTAHVGGSGLSGVGAVVGATKASADGRRLRGAMPDQFFLVPGVGAQGGTVEEVRPLMRAGAASPGGLGVVVNASRSVIFAEAGAGEAWTDAVVREAHRLADDLRALAG